MIMGMDAIENAAEDLVRALGAEKDCPICHCRGTQHETHCEVAVLLAALDDVYCEDCWDDL